MPTLTIAQAEHILELVKNGEDHQVGLVIDALFTPDGTRLLTEIETLLIDIQSSRNEALGGIEGELATSAAFRCQNALEQLAYIVEQGSSAATSTLDNVEKVQTLLASIKNSSSQEAIFEEVNGLLVDIMIKQSYQDLTEQVVVKLRDFVERIETSLSQLVDLNKAVAIESGLGPSVTTMEREDSVDAQDDIDALLQASFSKSE